VLSPFKINIPMSHLYNMTQAPRSQFSNALVSHMYLCMTLLSNETSGRPGCISRLVVNEESDADQTPDSWRSEARIGYLQLQWKQWTSSSLQWWRRLPLQRYCSVDFQYARAAAAARSVIVAWLFVLRGGFQICNVLITKRGSVITTTFYPRRGHWAYPGVCYLVTNGDTGGRTVGQF